jgi:hypothetical protein
VFHWYRASGAFSTFSDVLGASNFSGKGTTPVGASGAVNLFGTVDMAGNVKEWCANATATGRRFVLGGSFADASWQFRDQDAQSPLERRAGFGLRLIEPSAALDAKMTAPIKTVERDPASLKPVSDDVYRVYVRQFDYDRTPLDVIAEATQDTPEWRREKVSVVTAYGKDRLPIYVFVPASAKPPFQAVVFYPAPTRMRRAPARVWLCSGWTSSCAAAACSCIPSIREPTSAVSPVRAGRAWCATSRFSAARTFVGPLTISNQEATSTSRRSRSTG